MHRETAQNLEKTLYTTTHPDEESHRCVVLFDNQYAVTYKHGAHSLLREGQKLTLYNVVDRDLTVEVIVFRVPEDVDLVLLQSVNRYFPNYPRTLQSLYDKKEYYQLGVDQNRQPIWREGIVSMWRPGHYVGILKQPPTDSGANFYGIFNSYGRLMAIPVADYRWNVASSLSDLQISTDNGPVADQLNQQRTKLFTADFAWSYLGIKLPGYVPT